MSSIICFIVCLLMFLIFAGLGIYFWCSKKPANFWSGEKIPPDAISDIKKYNRANGIMWFVYGVLYLIPAFVALTNVLNAGILIFILTVGCTPILILIYVKIIRPKYVSKDLL